MAFEPGDVVFLKSGGSPMTVTAVGEDSVDCLWIGEEGELFRESISSVALMIGSDPADEDEDDEDDEDAEDNENEPGDDETDGEKVDEDEVKSAKSKRKVG
jgi:uncharacterized protein YodC (DUF2158 family)